LTTLQEQVYITCIMRHYYFLVNQGVTWHSLHKNRARRAVFYLKSPSNLLIPNPHNFFEGRSVVTKEDMTVARFLTFSVDNAKRHWYKLIGLTLLVIGVFAISAVISTVPNQLMKDWGWHVRCSDLACFNAVQTIGGFVGIHQYIRLHKECY